MISGKFLIKHSLLSDPYRSAGNATLDRVISKSD